MASAKKFKNCPKSRKWNWDVKETWNLLDVCESEKRKLINGITLSQDGFWERVTDVLYPTDSPFRRTRDEVQKKWRNLCAALRFELYKNTKKYGEKNYRLPPVLTRVSEILNLEDLKHNKMTPRKKISNSERLNNVIHRPLLLPKPSRSTDVKTVTQLVMPSSSVSKVESILQTSSTSSDDKESTKIEVSCVPFIKGESRSPSPPLELLSNDNFILPDTAMPKLTHHPNKSNPQIFTIAASPSTSTSQIAPSPYKIISIVNPTIINSTTTCSAPAKLILKSINSLPNVPKPSTSNMVLLGSNKNSSPQTQNLKKPFITPGPFLVQTTNKQQTDSNSDSLRCENEKITAAQEQLKLDRVLLEKEKIEFEKEKLNYEKTVFLAERNNKRVLQEEKKNMLERKKLKTEIEKLNLEKEILLLQLQKMQNELEHS